MFDPYHKWLGISRKDQPANHYRLLAIDLYESDPDVIDAAANRQMAYVQQRATGKHMALSQKLLNELTAARLCLLDAQKHAAYNAELKEELAEAAPTKKKARSTEMVAKLEDRKVLFKAAALDKGADVAAKAAAVAAAPRTSDPLAFLQANRQPVPETLRRAAGTGAALASRALERKKSRAKALPLPILVACGLASAVIIVLLCYLLIPSKDANELAKESAAEKAGASASSAKTEKDPRSESPQPRDDRRSNRANPQTVPVTQKEALPESKVPLLPDAQGATPLVPSPPAREKPPEPPPVPPRAAPKAPEQPKKHAVPSGDVQTAIAEQLKEVFGSKPPVSDEKKIELARQLQELADKTKNPDERFVLLRKAAELACAAGDATLMLKLIDEMPNDFDIDSLVVEQKLFGEFVASAGNVSSNPTLLPTAQILIRKALARGLNDTALSLAHELRMASEKPGGVKYRMAAKKVEAFFKQRLDHWTEFQEAQSKLKTSPDDADANLVVGRWHGVDNVAWATGLPFLAKGSDEELRQLAKAELAANAAQGAELVKLADQWWDLAQTRKDDEKLSLLEHASEQYERALTNLDAGLVRARVEKRLAEIRAQASWPNRKEMAANLVNAINLEAIIPGSAVAGQSAKNAIAANAPKTPKGRGATKAGGTAQPTTILEGVGFGAFHVGASADELSKALGEPDQGSDQRWLKWMSRHHLHCLMDEKRGAVELRFEPGFQFPLASGIHFGSTENALVAAYGKPDNTKVAGTAKLVEYDGRGVLFWLHDGRVGQIVVFQRAGGGGAAAGNNAPRVSLTGPPYPASYPGAPTDKLSIQYAVMEILKQVRLKYDFNGSRNRTDPVCRQWCQPHIVNQPWPAALETILAPVGLSYDLNGDTVILKRK